MNKLFTTLLVCLMCFTASATVYTWNGNKDASWVQSGNWTVGGVNQDDDVADAFPGPNDDVIIPAGCTTYPVLGATTTIHDIFFEVRYMDRISGVDLSDTETEIKTTTSARLKNQHLLTYNKAYCDVTIRANRWVRITAPLKNTFSGDYFVEHQTLDKTAWDKTNAQWPFVNAEYIYTTRYTNPSDYVNRSKKGTYYSYYSSNRVTYDPFDGLEEDMSGFNAQWGEASNPLKTVIQPAMGFDVWVNLGSKQKNGEVTFHFPSGTYVYNYFDDSGNLAQYRNCESFARDAAHNQGKMALDETDVDDEGKATLTVTREGSGVHSKMWAVGNPAFAYLDIARFIHKNVDLNHIYRYVYTHNEDYAGRGTEDIYFYSRRSGDKLYKLTTAVGPSSALAMGNTNPNGPTASKSEVETGTRPAFINPAEGFRVFGGGVSYKCLVPDLVGIYASARVTIAPQVCEKYYKDGSWQSSYTNTQVPMLKDGYMDFDYSVTVTDNPNQVRINNFLNLGSVVATIDTTAKTLTIPAGTKIMAVLGGDGKCDGDSDDDLWNFTESGSTYDQNASTYSITYSGSKVRVLKIYGLNDDKWSFGSKLNVYSGMYADNITNVVTSTSANDIVLKYTIDADGTHIDMNPSNCKKILVRSDAVSNRSTNKPAYHHDDDFPGSCLCEAWFAFEGMNSSKPADLGGNFIMLDMNMEGKYQTQTAGTARNFNGVGTKTWYGNIEIARIAGRSNVVTIKGLYPNDTKTPALGQIERRSSTAFTYSDFTQNSNKKAVKNGITIELSSGRGNTNTYVNVPSSGTISISSADNFTITRVLLSSHNTSNTYNRIRTWSSSVGVISVTDGDYKATWQGKESVITLKNTSGNAAEIESMEVTYRDENGNEYYLCIPSGQLVHMAGTSPAPETDYYFYSHGNAGVRMRTIEMKWIPTGAYNNTSMGYWEMTSLSDSKGCKGTMVTRCGMQPDMSSLSGTIGAVIGGETYKTNGNTTTSRHFCKFHRTAGSASADDWGAREDFNPGAAATAGQIDLTFTPDMFQANMADALAEPVLTAPSRVAASVSNLPVIIAAVTADSMLATTMIEVASDASDAFHPMEDAPLFDVEGYDFAFGTLAGSYLVAVNSIVSEELIPLYLSKSASLTFSNISTLGDAYLYDAVADTRVLINDTCAYELEILEGQQAGRYFIETHIEAPAIETDVENVETFGWKPVAYCPAEGSLSVACAEAVRFEIFNINGQMVGSADQSTTFNGMSAGVYVVSATRGAEKQSLKVIVY